MRHISPSLTHEKRRSFLFSRLDLLNRTDPDETVRNVEYMLYFYLRPAISDYRSEIKIVRSCWWGRHGVVQWDRWSTLVVELEQPFESSRNASESSLRSIDDLTTVDGARRRTGALRGLKREKSDRRRRELLKMTPYGDVDVQERWSERLAQVPIHYDFDRHTNSMRYRGAVTT